MRFPLSLARVLLATLILAFGLAWSSAAQAEEPRPSVAEGESEGKEEGEGHAPGDHASSDHADSEEHGASKGHGKHASRLTDEVIPLQLEGFPQRPKPILELGEPFLGTGTLRQGFRLPTGAVWQPSLLAFGSLRTGVQSFERDGARVSEWANRLDFFLNLQLSGSERLVVGVRPLDQDGRFSSYVLDSDLPGIEDGSQEEFNAEIESLFFEGDFGEIFPNLSRDDFAATDIGFSIGRQPLLFQEGILINDSIEGIGLTRNTVQPKNTSNFRTTLFWGWNEVGRSGIAGNAEDDKAQLFGLLTSTDFRRSTVDADFVYVTSDEVGGDLLAGGISAVQRIGRAATSFRLLASSAVDEETVLARDGILFFSEASWTPPYSQNLFYINTFWAVDEFTSAARGPAAGGPLGRAGINFAAVGLGNYGAPLSSTAHDVAGGAIGYQWFFDHTRKQLILEFGARVGTQDSTADEYAVTARYQTAFGRRFVFVVDGFAGQRQRILPGAGDEDLFGGRLELVLKF